MGSRIPWRTSGLRAFGRFGAHIPFFRLCGAIVDIAAALVR